MLDAALDWLADISFEGVPGVPGVPPQKSATFSGTPCAGRGVPGVPVSVAEHLGTPSEHLHHRRKFLENNKEHLGTPGTPKNNDAVRCSAMPSALLDGLERLRRDEPPRISRPAIWPEVVADANRLVRDGWAEQALALGWHPLELFGASPAIGGDDRLEGLAVWLGGRRIVLLDERSAIASEGRARLIFNRRPYDGAAFLWEIASIQQERGGSKIERNRERKHGGARSTNNDGEKGRGLRP